MYIYICAVSILSNVALKSDLVTVHFLKAAISKRVTI